MSNNKNFIHNQIHLTLSDRTYIEQELCQGTPFKRIANTLGKDPTTISKEVKRNRTIIPENDYGGYKCRTEIVNHDLIYT